ncbi:hypothetical protein Droror1_Dr00023557, partial [Drosera rotundifolia]
MVSHHRRKRQQDARVEMDAVEEGKEEEEKDEDEVEKIGFQRVVVAVVENKRKRARKARYREHMALSSWPILSLPPLASNNYNQWSIQMKTFLR